MSDHSPLPWRRSGRDIIGSDNDPICTMNAVHPHARGDQRKLPQVDGDMLIRSVNSHADLLNALQTADRLLASMAGEGWPDWDEAKAIRGALAKASA